MNRDARHVIALGAAKAVTAPLFMINAALVARLLGPAGFGDWAMVAAAAMLLHALFLNWSQAGVVRFGCEEWARAHSLASTLTGRTPLALLGLLAVATMLGLDPFQWLGRFFLLRDGRAWLVGAYVVALWVTAESQAALQATGRMQRQAVASVVAATLGVVVLAALLGLGWSGSTLSAVVLGLAAVTVAVWGAVLVGVLGEARMHWPCSAAEPIARQLRYGWPLLPGFIVGYVSDWGDHLIIRQYLTSDALGLFQAAYQAMLAVIALNVPLTTVLLPRLAAGALENPGNERGYLVNVLPTICSLWVLPVMAVIGILPALFLQIMGEGFAAAVPIVAILAVTIPSSVVPAIYTVLFSVQQRLARAFVFQLAMAVVNVAVSLMLVPRVGTRGAAFGTVVSYAIGQALYMWDQHRFLRVQMRRMAAIYGIVIVVAATQVILDARLPARMAWSCVAIVVLAVVFRRLQTVDTLLLERLFAGRLSPVERALQRMFAPARA